MTSYTDVFQLPLSQDLAMLQRYWRERRCRRYRPVTQFVLNLNAVALYLTTGRSDGVIATFFHEATSTLYLAKSGPWSSEDADMATSFVTCLKDAKGYRDLLPFLAQYSSANVEKKVRKLRHSFSLCQYTMTEIAQEHDDEEEKTALDDCLNDLKTCLFAGSSESDLDNDSEPEPFRFDDTAEAADVFISIVVASRKFLKVIKTFQLKSPISSRRRGTIDPDLLRLERHLVKIAQYRQVHRLIKFVKNSYQHNAEITVFYIPDASTDQRRPGVSLNTYYEIFTDRHLDSYLARIYTQGDVDAKVRKHMASALDCHRKYYRYHPDAPTLADVTLFVHPEIRLIMYLTDVIGVQNDHAIAVQNDYAMGLQNDYPPGTSIPLYVACGKGTCRCCEEWIRGFSGCLEDLPGDVTMEWTPTYTNNEMRWDWMIPDPDSTQHVEDAVRQGDDAVLEYVQREGEEMLRTRLENVIEEIRRRSWDSDD